MVQGVSTTLRKVSKELFLLEDTIDSIKADKSLLVSNVFVGDSHSTNFVNSNERHSFHMP